MQNKFTETNPRDFNPVSVPGLSADARKAVNAVFDAMSGWRTETINKSEEGIGQVIEKMAAAARALGWPDEIVEVTRAQMQGMTKMQIQTMDHMMDAWEEQIKSLNAPSAMLSKLKDLPGFGATGSWPNADAFQRAAMKPLSALHAIRATVPENLGRYDGLLDEGGQALVVVIG